MVGMYSFTTMAESETLMIFTMPLRNAISGYHVQQSMIIMIIITFICIAPYIRI